MLSDTSLADILVVDDTPANLRLLTQMLTGAGYRVRPVTNGADALATAQISPPDLVLLDVMMPEMDGFAVAAQIHSAEATHQTPIIFISALDDAESKLRAFSSGGADYITKPFQSEEVLARIQTHLRLQREVARREGLISELQLLNKIARSLIVYSDLQEMLQSVIDGVVQIVRAERAFLLLVDIETQTLLHFVQSGKGRPFPSPAYTDVMEGLSGWVIQKVQPILSPKGQADPREGPRARSFRAEYQIGGMILTPLYCQGRMLGVLSASRALEADNFTHENLATLNAVAAQIAVAVRGMELAEEMAYLKEFNEGIVQGVAEAILITDMADAITFANPAALAMLGYSEADLVGQSAFSIVPPAQQARVRLENERRAAGKSGHYETELLHAAGWCVPVLASARPLFQGKAFSGALTAFTDITELKQAEEQLRRYAADLESQNAELDAFAHTVAHDLKSPLTVLIGFADLLRSRSQNLSVTEREQLQMISQTGHKMRTIIEELLLLSKVRMVEQIETSVVDMAAVVQETLGRMAYLVSETHAEVLTPTQWPAALGHAPWIEEVWVNYLSNALKYGGRPEADIPPRVEFGFDAMVDAPAHIRFWVRDNGAGLAPEQQRQLFTPFERLHSGRVDGHGLGLSIVRRIIEKLGGRVGVECAPGEGCQFYFTLPAATLPPGVASETPVAEPLGAALAVVPTSVRVELHAAVVDADVQRIAAAIAACRERDMELAAALQTLADTFAHDDILRLLELAESACGVGAETAG